jgi:hypothetical protein
MNLWDGLLAGKLNGDIAYAPIGLIEFAKKGDVILAEGIVMVVRLLENANDAEWPVSLVPSFFWNAHGLAVLVSRVTRISKVPAANAVLPFGNVVFDTCTVFLVSIAQQLPPAAST